MARSILDIVIKLSKQGGADRETVKGLVQVKSTLSQVAGVAGVVTGALYTAKKAFDFSKEGAQLQFVEQRFDRLSASIGANAGLMGDLREVTRGLYSDTQLMTSAADLMGLGLAKDTDTLARMMKVSSGLNQNMNQLVLTLTNMTTMRFDALNMSVDGFKERVKALEDAGMSAEEAFAEAFLQQGEAQLLRVGEAEDSTAGSFMQLEAASSNLFDSIKRDSAEAGAAFASFVAARLNELNAWRQSMEKASEAGFTDQRSRIFVTNLQRQADAVSDLAASYDQAHMFQQTFTADMGELAATTETYSLSLDTVQAAISGKIVKAQEDYRENISSLKDELADLQEQESAWTTPPVRSKKYDELQEKIAGVEKEIRNTTAAYQEQARQIMFNIGQEQILASSMSDSQKAAAVAALGQSMEMWDQQTANAITRTSEWVSLLEAGTLTVDQFAVRMNQAGEATFGIDTAAENAYSSTAMLTGAQNRLTDSLYDTERSALIGAEGLNIINSGLQMTRQHASSGKEQVDGLRNQLSKLDGMQATATVNIITNGSIPSIPRGAGGQQGFRVRAGQGRAAGGQLGNFNIVGEEGWEAIVKDNRGRYTVIPHGVSRELARLGLLEGARGFLEGGSLPGDWTIPTTTSSSTSSSGGSSGGYGPATGHVDIGDLSGVLVGGQVISDSSQAAAVSADVTQTVTPLVETTEQAVESLAAAQVQQNIEGRQTRAVLVASNAEIAGILRDIDKRLQKQEKTFVVAVQAAVQQAPR